MPKVCPVCATTYPDANVFCPVDGTTLRAAELDGDLIGSVVADRYLVTDLLGEGGMGKVYLARHVRLPQQAAIKVLRAELIRDSASVARFNREASNASQVDDEHVARVYDFGETADGLVYLAMEYVPGKTLRAILADEGPLSPQRTVGLVRQIADGLDAAHRLPKPLIHRDLKPDNVLVTPGPGGRDRVKVVDFGIAKAFGADDGNLTKTGFVVGTPEFMSPEQLLGESLDPRSDVYALALLAFQCLTGAMPFEMTTPERAMMARLTEPPRHLLDLCPDVAWPAALEAVFDAALARDREARPESAGAFAERFAAAIERVAPIPEARPVAVAAPAARAPTAPTPMPAPRQGAPRWAIVGGALAAIGVVAAGLAMWSSRAPLPAGQSTPPAAPVTSAALPAENTTAPADTTVPRRPADGVARPVEPSVPARRRETAADAPPVEERASSEAVSDRQYAAGLVLDSLAGLFRRGAVDAPTARGVAAAIRELVPRLSRTDRARAQLALIEASTLSGDVASACAALRAARDAATSPEQRAAVRRYDEQLGCG